LQSPLLFTPTESQMSSKVEQPLVPGMPPQHGSSALPHGQRPFRHWPNVLVELLVMHVAPSAMQTPEKQHPLPAQTSPSQQGAPGVPQVAQTPTLDDDEVIEQTVPGPQRSAALVPAQQVSPAWPHGVQTPVRQARPARQLGPQQT
jgi:hypothetical protein